MTRAPIVRAIRLATVSLIAVALLGPGSAPAGAALPEGGAFFPYDTATELVDHVFGDVLFRPPTTEERAAQVHNVRYGRSAATLAARLGQTTEFHSLVAPQARLYQAFFLRGPDRAGLAFWVGRSRAGMSLNKVADFFTTSEEFQRRYGSVDDAGFVAMIYTNVLNRPGDVDGQAFWVRQLGAGWSRGRVMALFSESEENKRATAVRMRITTSFVQVIARAPSEDEVALWTARFAEGSTAESFMYVLYATPELERRVTLISAGGAGNAWSYLLPSTPTRWDPCAPVVWRLNPSGAPGGARLDIREAFRRLAAATGLDFVEGADTSYVPNVSAPPPTEEVYIAYSTTAVFPQLSGLAGLGGFFTDGVVRQGFAAARAGIVILNRGVAPIQTPGFSAAGHGSVLMHELAHVVGLGHTSAAGQAMYPSIGGGWQGRRWGNGDQTGLGSVGERRGCYPWSRSSTPAGDDDLVPVIAAESHH